MSATLDAEGNVWIDGKIVPSNIDWAQFDATTEEDIARHIAEDDAEARAEGARWARSVRAGPGLTQDAFAGRIGVPVATVRDWEQGKRLRVIAREPDAVRRALAG